MTARIVGTTARDIATNVRSLVDAGAINPGDSLPPVRQLAESLGVNRNTVVAAYRQLVVAGVAVTNRRAGTSIAPVTERDEEGFATEKTLRDISSGNPSPAYLPDPASVRLPPSPPVLYGESTIDPGLAHWATTWFTADQPREFRLAVTNGAVDAIDKLLSQTLSHGDAVGLEDPCFLTSINAARRAGYRPVPIPMDSDGMTPEGLQAALTAGARVVVCTPRAHNPTGVSVSRARAAELQRVLADHPHVLVVEDDHFSLLTHSDYHSIIAADHQRWAVIRSVSKFLGPDLRLAMVASDAVTAEHMTRHISAGSSWVSHLLQRIVVNLLGDDEVRERIRCAGAHYRHQHAYFIDLLAERGIHAIGSDGLNVWVQTGTDAHAVADHLLQRGWIVRTGDRFAVGAQSGSQHLRLTVHELDSPAARDLADTLAEAIAAVAN